MTKELLEIISKARNSSFSRYGSTINIPIESIIKSIENYTNSDKFATYYEEKGIKISTSFEFLNNAIPAFQRSNNKWTKTMQSKFVENLLYGVKTSILLFKIKEDTDYKIIDGLQRTTAILDFLDGKFKIFKKYSIEELRNCIDGFDSKLTITLYSFDTWEEVGKFYIDMNENITHSKVDIQKAKDWFLKEKNIIL